MSNISIKKSVGLSILAVLLAISVSIIPTNISYTYVEFDVSGSESGEDRSITSSQGSLDRVHIVMHHQMLL